MGEKTGVVPSPLHITKRRLILGARLYLQDLFAPPPQLEGSDFLGLQGGSPRGLLSACTLTVTGAALPLPIPQALPERPSMACVLCRSMPRALDRPLNVT